MHRLRKRPTSIPDLAADRAMSPPTQRTVADWVAVHGNAVIPDSGLPVTIAHYAREAVVSPKLGTDHWATGVVHFPVPSPPSGSTRPTKLLVNFETDMAVFHRVEIYYGASEVYQLTLTENDTLECLDISNISSYGVEPGRSGHGINVSITIKFRQPNSQVSFESLGMVYNK
jgi:hypothetical protein